MNPYPDMPRPVRPSEVTDFIRCNKLWEYKHLEGWRPPDSAWEPWQLMGSAVHAGLAAYWDWKRVLGVGSQAVHEEPLRQVFRNQWPSTAPPEFNREGLESLALKVLDKVLVWIAKEMPDAQPVMVEEPLAEDGHTTPDLVTIEEGDILTVTDWKTSANLPAEKMMYRLQEIDRTWQFLHYCWAVGKHLGRPVQRFRKVVIAMGPKILVRSAEFAPTEEMIAAWYRDAEVIWDLMNKMRNGTVYPWRNENGCLKYGAKYRCPYYEACWTCFGNESKMGAFLVKGEPGA